MFLRQLDLTTALRPSLLPDETLLFVQDAVGLYEGKYKIPSYQNGHVYLTSHRVCYVDNQEPRKHAVAIDLKDVERPEFYAGFLKSSPKVTVYARQNKRSSMAVRSPIPSYASSTSPTTSSPPTRSGTPARAFVPSPAPSRDTNATWICPICSFSNPVPSNFDPATANAHTPLPPCLACGIKPPLVHVVKAAIAAISNRPSGATSTPFSQSHPSRSAEGASSATSTQRPAGPLRTSTSIQCPRCTFRNHVSLLSCEICGASLVPSSSRHSQLSIETQRPESPGPSLNSPTTTDITESIKFSFRAGGEKLFFERLKSALIQRKWLLQSAPPIPTPSHDQDSSGSTRIAADGTPQQPKQPKTVGIAGLERRGLELRKNNELVIGSAFEDLEALMTSAKEVIAMAERFARQSAGNGNAISSAENALLSESASALGLVTTKDMLAGGGSGAATTYITELSRDLAEFLTDDARGVLRREGGIMSLVDLWAVFNRTRNGIELVSPLDFDRAARMWDTLRLPIRLRRFKSGLLVVQGRDRTDDKTVASLLAWLRELHSYPPSSNHTQADAFVAPEWTPPCTWDWRVYGRGVTAQETAERFGWSVGVASEELEMAEERGALCREQGIDGVRFWENWIGVAEPVGRESDEERADREIRRRLEESGLL